MTSSMREKLYWNNIGAYKFVGFSRLTNNDFHADNVRSRTSIRADYFSRASFLGALGRRM